VVRTASHPSIAPSQVIAGPAVEPHTLAVLTGDNAEAVVLDLVQPQLRMAGPRHWRGGMAE
jgi:hypothetical protein